MQTGLRERKAEHLANNLGQSWDAFSVHSAVCAVKKAILSPCTALWERTHQTFGVFLPDVGGQHNTSGPDRPQLKVLCVSSAGGGVGVLSP